MKALTESCDACGPYVQAKARMTVLTLMLPLYFCGHCTKTRLAEDVDVPCDFIVEYEAESV